jgi:hypothetical protein
MKRMAIFALIGALVLGLVAGTAGATPGKGKGQGPRAITYLFHGTVTTVTQASTDPTTGTPTPASVTVDVKQGNNAAKKYVGQEVPFNVDSSTKIEVNGKENATLSDIQPGDTVMVQVKQSQNTSSSLTARQLQVQSGDSTGTGSSGSHNDSAGTDSSGSHKAGSHKAGSHK